MEEILKAALRKADDADLFYAETGITLARHALDRIEACKTSVDKGYGLRVLRKGRTGFAFFTRPEDSGRAIDEAVRMARLLPKENASFPKGLKKYKALKTFDRKVARITEEDAADMILALIGGASRKASPVKGEVSAANSYKRLINSNGVDAEVKETTFFAYSEAKKKKNISFDEYSSSRKGDPQAIGESAGEWAALGAGGKPAAFKGRVCLGTEALSAFFAAAIMTQFDGEAARRGKTRWADKLGKRVMHPRISVSEDPHRPWGRASAAFDDEGMATKKKALVRNGVMKQHLYDARSAAISKTKPTGNGYRISFSDPPETSVTNIVVEPSERCNAMRESGLFVRELMGFHNMNPVTGDFALSIVNGFLLDSGELGAPVRGSLLRGNIFDILREDPRFDKKDMTYDWFTSPRMCFEAEVVK